MAQISQWQASRLCLALLLHSLLVRAQSGDGGSADGFANSNLAGAGNGADGNSNSSANLSKGAIIAIAVVVVVVVLGGVTLAILFFVAKKRQWEIRQTIRRTTTRVVRAMTPRTPAKMSFGPLKSPKLPAEGQSHTFMKKNQNVAKHGDVEKGFQSIDEQVARSSEESGRSKQKQAARDSREAQGNKKEPKAKPAGIAVPSSHFEMDSPKSPMWQRVFGRN